MVTKECRRNRTRNCWRLAWRGAKITASIAEMAGCVVLLGGAVAVVSLALAGPARNGLAEGRSMAAGAELDVIRAGGIEKPMVPMRWEPRGPARLCLSWCEPSGAACIDVCQIAGR